jgi:hypothetical protein
MQLVLAHISKGQEQVISEHEYLFLTLYLSDLTPALSREREQNPGRRVIVLHFECYHYFPSQQEITFPSALFVSTGMPLPNTLKTNILKAVK